MVQADCRSRALLTINRARARARARARTSLELGDWKS